MAAPLSRAELIARARTLPASLLTFFARFPPAALGPRVLAPLPPDLPSPPANFGQPAPPAPHCSIPRAEPDRNRVNANASSSSSSSFSSSPSPSPSSAAPPATDPTTDSQLQFVQLPADPFQPWRNPMTGRVRGPFYGRKTQASIAARARQFGVEQLLPDSAVKKTGVAEARRVRTGLRAPLRGNAVSAVKGHRWERTLEDRVEKRRDAMLNMNKLIAEWKQTGFGRGWKSFPKRTSKR